jgi:hypothetical protein
METLKFELDEIETQRCQEFCKAHEECPGRSMGEKILISFLPTTMGDVVMVRCLSCGAHQDITNTDKF